jgi:hypothetical protein
MDRSYDEITSEIPISLDTVAAPKPIEVQLVSHKEFFRKQSPIGNIKNWFAQVINHHFKLSVRWFSSTQDMKDRAHLGHCPWMRGSGFFKSWDYDPEQPIG